MILYDHSLLYIAVPFEIGSFHVYAAIKSTITHRILGMNGTKPEIMRQIHNVKTIHAKNHQTSVATLFQAVTRRSFLIK